MKNFDNHGKTTTYKIQQKAFSMSGKYNIQNEMGENIYLVQKKGFFLGRTRTFFDLNGQELYKISRKWVFFGPSTYLITQNGVEVVKVQQKFSLLKSKFSVNMPKGEAFQVEGKFWKRTYQFLSGGQEVVSVKNTGFMTDHYMVEIDNHQDHVLVLAVIIAMDMIIEDNRN